MVKALEIEKAKQISFRMALWTAKGSDVEKEDQMVQPTIPLTDILRDVTTVSWKQALMVYWM